MNKRKTLALVLAALLAFGVFALPAAADESVKMTPQEYAATLLFQLALFQGMGTNEDGSPDFGLDTPPTREQAVTMLVRLLGKDGAAGTNQYASPFEDVADWAKPYVGYAYQNGLTTGTSETTFSGSSPVTAAQYLTFVLRALGYSSETDFQWDRAYVLSQELMITIPGQYENANDPFTRGDVAMISAMALGATMKDSDMSLLSYLNTSGVFQHSETVIFDLEVLGCKKDSMDFVFFPLAGSPTTYKSFKLDKVTVNGLSCTISQQQNRGAAVRERPELEQLYPEVFNLATLSYDEEAAQKAATNTYSPAGSSESFPVLVFTFEGTGTLENGKTVKESFSEAVYINGYQ